MTDADPREFMARIIAEPAAMEPRLVYADFLTERGDPRGELIQIQCQPAVDEIAQPALQRRLDEILREHQTQWLIGAAAAVLDVT